MAWVTAARTLPRWPSNNQPRAAIPRIGSFPVQTTIVDLFIRKQRNWGRHKTCPYLQYKFCYFGLPITPGTNQSKDPISFSDRVEPSATLIFPFWSVSGPLKTTILPESRSASVCLTLSCTVCVTFGPNGASAMQPSLILQRRKMGFQVLSITDWVKKVTVPPRVKPVPVIQYSGANCWAAKSWKPIE